MLSAWLLPRRLLVLSPSGPLRVFGPPQRQARSAMSRWCRKAGEKIIYAGAIERKLTLKVTFAPRERV